MDSALVYIGSQHMQSLSREALVYANTEMALAQLARLDRRLITSERDSSGRWPPGLFDIVSQDKVIAIGMLAHTMLADFHKCSLLAADHRMNGEMQGCDDVARLIWSCANTSRAVAVGEEAWCAVQMLPMAERRHYEVPPLKLPQHPHGVDPMRMFIVNHDRDDLLARELAALAGLEGFSTACSAMTQSDDHSVAAASLQFCCPEAAIHVHVGLHAQSANRFRLIDSWHSGRIAVQLLPVRPAPGSDDGNLMVEDEANGFICRSAEAVIAICRELQQDPVLGRKLTRAGHRSAGPLARAWTAIAHDLLVDQ